LMKLFPLHLQNDMQKLILLMMLME